MQIEYIEKNAESKTQKLQKQKKTEERCSIKLCGL